MSKYDSNTRTTTGDVSREASEAKTEIGQAAAAAKAMFGSGTAADAVKEAKEALAASAEVVEAAADLVCDTVKDAVAKGLSFFKQKKLGYSIHDPEQNVVLHPQVVTPAEKTAWMEAQVKAGYVVEVTPEEANDALKAPLVRDELSGG